MSWCNKPFAVIANLLSATQNPEMGRYLAEELQLGCIVHISDPSALPFFQYSPFGVIPKKYKPGKWRLIFNLSAPHNHAVKDAILKEALLTIPCFGG